MLLRIDLYYTWVQLLHLCLPQVPLTRNPDPWSEFGLRGNQIFSLVDGIFRGVIFSHLYQSVNKEKVKWKKLRLTLLRSKMKKKYHFSFVGMLIKSKIISAEEAPLPSSEGKDETVQSLFYFINVLGHRITWRDMLCMTALKAGLPACGSSTVVFVHCRGGKWNCYSYKFKFFIHFLLEVFPTNRLRSSMDS